MLSMLSFTAMRTIGADTGGGISLPDSGVQSASAPTTPAPKPKAKAEAPPKVADVPPAVANALASGKVVVLLFAEKGAADDAATSKHFSALSRLGGRVRTFRAGLADVGRYAGILADLQVSQAPSVVIVRPDLRALPPIEGYVDAQYLLQRVRDQLR
jgi:hypothetical protein